MFANIIIDDKQKEHVSTARNVVAIYEKLREKDNEISALKKDIDDIINANPLHTLAEAAHAECTKPRVIIKKTRTPKSPGEQLKHERMLAISQLKSIVSGKGFHVSKLVKNINKFPDIYGNVRSNPRIAPYLSF
jgi:hypothetical protein